eukprot:3617596-Prymnesium_polylepis.2
MGICREAMAHKWNRLYSDIAREARGGGRAVKLSRRQWMLGRRARASAPGGRAGRGEPVEGPCALAPARCAASLRADGDSTLKSFNHVNLASIVHRSPSPLPYRGSWRGPAILEPLRFGR